MGDLTTTGPPAIVLAMTAYRTITRADEITEHILVLVGNCVEDRFAEGPMPTEDFIDRLCDDYAEGWDIEQLDTPAVRKIMRHAREVQRELA